MSLRSYARRQAQAWVKGAALAGAALLAQAAHAGLYTSNFGSLVPGYVANDDSTFAVTLPFAVSFFGSTYTSAVVSNNGNVQFGTNSGEFISSPLNTQTSFRGIAAYWSDLDSRSDPLGAIAAGTGGSGVYMSASSGQVVFTWDRLGYFDRDYGNRVQFQLVLNDPSAMAAGEGSIGFFFGGMQGQSSRPSRTAAIGFGDGLSAINPGEVSLASGISGDVAAYANRAGHVWFNTDSGGTPVQNVPEPASLGLAAAAFGALGWVRRRRSR